jgi:hypothetical protein
LRLRGITSFVSNWRRRRERLEEITAPLRSDEPPRFVAPWVRRSICTALVAGVAVVMVVSPAAWWVCLLVTAFAVFWAFGLNAVWRDYGMSGQP